ncbi:MAG: TonB-dependent receptor plug domain-containing protein [Nitrospinales bacterium]
MRFIRFTIIFLISILVFPEKGFTVEIDDLLDKDLIEIMQMEVTITSVNKRPQKLSDTASAIYVISSEDIKRSGATNIMEALRMAPGVTVSRIDQNHYAISIRGFNRQFQTKLLVLIDGRSVYSPSFGGVFWESQDTMLEDVDRIEIIRGPGAALWGSNAVAGVINIITKDSSSTQGFLIAGGAGTEEKGFASVRFGGRAGENFNYRVYGKYRDRDSGHRNDGTPPFDNKLIRQGGFRSEWQPGEYDEVTFQGDYYNFELERDEINHFNSFAPPFVTPLREIETRSGGNGIIRWTRDLGDESSIKVQAYYDRAESNVGSSHNSLVEQIDLEAQYDFHLNPTNFVSLGINYRFTVFNIDEDISLKFPNRDTNLFGIFINDEITLIPKKLSVIIGTKLEHNEFSGLEVQPNLRAVWKPKLNHTVWAAVSRAVRIPTVSEEGLVNNSGSATVPVVVRVMGDGRSEAEELLAFEIGYRTQITPKLSLDVTGYANYYKNLIELTMGASFVEMSPAPAHPVSPLIFDNALEGEVFGVEVNSEWNPVSYWRIMGGYTFSTVDLRSTLGNVIPAGFSAEDDPQHLFNVRSYLTISDSIEFDTLLYFRGKNINRMLPSHTRLDMRLGWNPVSNIKMSLIGQNLLSKHHPEFNNKAVNMTETQRSVIGKVEFKF